MICICTIEDPESGADSSHELREPESKGRSISLGLAVNGWGQLSKLNLLNLSNNHLTGERFFVVELSTLVCLVQQRLVLNVCSPNLCSTAGEIPESLGSLLALTELNLGRNQLAGRNCSYSYASYIRHSCVMSSSTCWVCTRLFARMMSA